MSEEQINKILREMMTSTVLPTIIFDLKDEPTSRYNCKIGGIPYLPPSFKYPTKGGEPLLFVLQINFEEFDHLENFPTKGILQFYVENDDLHGCEYGDYADRDGYKVTYFEDIECDESKLLDPPEIKADDYFLMKECKLIGKKGEGCMDSQDFRFEHLFKKYLAKFEIEGDEIEDKIRTAYYDTCTSNATTHIGAYPCFAQYDPRKPKEHDDYSITLIHIESGNDSNGNGVIMWGDSGQCTLFIKPDDLKNKKFDETLYYWDCC